jgi:hypothetical protein
MVIVEFRGIPQNAYHKTVDPWTVESSRECTDNIPGQQPPTSATSSSAPTSRIPTPILTERIEGPWERGDNSESVESLPLNYTDANGNELETTGGSVMADTNNWGGPHRPLSTPLLRRRFACFAKAPH